MVRFTKAGEIREQGRIGGRTGRGGGGHAVFGCLDGKILRQRLRHQLVQRRVVELGPII